MKNSTGKLNENCYSSSYAKVNKGSGTETPYSSKKAIGRYSNSGTGRPQAYRPESFSK